MYRKFDGRWSCLLTVNKPNEVNKSHLLKVYRLDNAACAIDSCRSMCKSNLRCLNGLFTDESDSESANEVETIDVSPYAVNCTGLKNYGSTCYLNAFLQIYFHFVELRQAVYGLPATVSSHDVIAQLQTIFSQMQLSRTGLVDPIGLIETLHLSEQDQQDAPEFHSLFMSLLEARFASFGRIIIQPLFKGTCIYETRCQVCGFISQRHSNFLELDIKVSSNSLADCLREYLAEEMLTGENQYACPQCCVKRDGVRCMRITQTPLMLCFQLLRFTYDVRSGRRVKQKTPICLPDTFDMAEFITPVSTATGRVNTNTRSLSFRPGLVYRLSGALLHLGRQSTSGHYIAVVRSPRTTRDKEELDCTSQNINTGPISDSTDCWNICNDEQVCTIPATQFDLSKVNGTTQYPLTKTPKESRTSTPVKVIPVNALPLSTTLDLEDDVSAALNEQPSVPRFHTSTTAYMVFYRQVTDSYSAIDVEVPTHLKSRVEACNSVFVQEAEDKRFKQMEQHRLSVERQSLRKAMLSRLMSNPMQVLSPLTPTEKRRRIGGGEDKMAEEEDLVLVPTQWLSAWLLEPEKTPPGLFLQQGTNKPTAALRNTLDSQGISPVILPLCSHAHVSPDALSQTIRAVSLSGLLASLQLTMNNSKAKNLSRLSPETYFESNCIVSSLSPCTKCIQARVAANMFSQACGIVNKELNRWKKASGGGTWPLSKSALNFLSSNFPVLPPSSNSLNQASVYFIGSKSLSRWRAKAQSFFTATIEADGVVSTVSTDFNADVLCSHGRLLNNCGHDGNSPLRCVPTLLWLRLVALFHGSSNPIPAFPGNSEQPNTEEGEACVECVAAIGDLLERAQREGNALGALSALVTASHANEIENCRDLDLLIDSVVQSSPPNSRRERRSDGSSPPHDTIPNGVSLNATELPTENPDESNGGAVIYLVPVDFINQWRRFIRSPSVNTLPGELPSGLAAIDALCEHDHLLMPWSELISENIVFPLSSHEWNVLHAAYDGVGEETTHFENLGEDDYPLLRLVRRTDNNFRVDTSPKESYSTVCTECYPLLQERRSIYVGARIFIRLTEDPNEVNDLVQQNLGPSEQTLNESIKPSNGVPKTPVTSVTMSEDCTSSTLKSPSSLLLKGDNSHPLVDSALDAVSSTSTTSSVRRSGRTRVNRDDFVLRVDSSSKLQDIRLQMMRQIGAAPFDQHLALDGIEFTDYSRTLLQLGIQPDALLHLWVDLPAPNATVEALRGGSDGSTGACGVNGGQVEKGFKGTRLVDSWSPSDTVSLSTVS